MRILSVASLREGTEDTLAAVRHIRLALIFGWQDVAQRYRRSRIGAFWLTINMGVLIGALGAIFGTLFRIPIREFLPFIGAGLILWGFIAQSIGDGCTSLSSAAGTILQIRLPYATHVYRVIWRNIVIFLHNIVILPLIFLALGILPTWWVLLAPIGFVLLIVNLAWMALIAAVICARYRDMVQVIQNVLQVLFYGTPIMWTTDKLPHGIVRQILNLNPMLHLIEVVRGPLLGTPPTALNWLTSVGLAVVGWVLALGLFGSVRRRIAYWL